MLTIIKLTPTGAIRLPDNWLDKFHNEFAAVKPQGHGFLIIPLTDEDAQLYRNAGKNAFEKWYRLRHPRTGKMGRPRKDEKKQEENENG